ncbi:MAG: S41 family peptidase [Planctomycetota bacterium]|nr:S41 family peptidase [Planctomycetota bacterium]
MTRPFALALVLGGLAGSGAAAPGEDLDKRYPATMSSSESGLSWESTHADVWRLKSFRFRRGKELEIACKKSIVVFGVHGTNVLWAVVFPEDPAEIETDLPGGGEKATRILLRFAPGEVGKVFPKKTVEGPGDPWLRARAGRIFRHKLGWKWFTPAGNPIIVPAGAYIVDVDTTVGKRRFYFVDKSAGSVEYVEEFESQPLPPLEPIKKRAAREAFDEAWEAFDREYAKFVDLPAVDWDRLGQEYRKHAGSAKTVFDLAAVIADMLAHLEDLHVWVKAGDDRLPGFQRERPLNGSWRATHAILGGTTEVGDDLVWGRTEDGIGYLNVHALNDEGLSAHADAALEELAGTWALIVDLRFNGGGDEVLGRLVAARFVDEERVYSTNQYRSGPKRDQLGGVLERRFAPRGPWRYSAPTVALWGRKTFSSAESLALMFAQCPQVTTMGDLTGGSSANPRRLELECGITVNLPRWRDMDPDGSAIENVGIAPSVLLEHEPEDFSATEDPVLEAALKHLRKIPRKKRKPVRSR